MSKRTVRFARWILERNRCRAVSYELGDLGRFRCDRTKNHGPNYHTSTEPGFLFEWDETDD